MALSDIKNSVVAALPPALQRLVSRASGSSLGARMARGAFWSVLATGTNRMLGLAMSIAIARLMGREKFGELGVVQSTIGVFGLVAGFGTGVTATRYIAELRQKDPARAGRVLALALVIAGVSAALAAVTLLGASPWLAVRTLAAGRLTGALRIGAALLFCETMNGTLTGALAGFEAFRAIAIVDLIAGILGVAFTVAGAWLDGLGGALLGMVAGQALHAAGYAVVLTRAAHQAGVTADWAGWSREARILWQFSLPALLAIAVASQINWLCRVVIVHQPDGYPQMGLFNAANQWRTAILFLPSTISHSFLPVLSNLVGNRDARNYRRVLWSSMALNGALALVAGLVVAAGSKLIMAGYGADFASGRSVLILLAGAAILAATVGTVGQAIISAGHMWWGFLLNAIWAASLIASTWWLRDRGAWGFAMANVIAYAVHLVTSIYFYYQTSVWLFGKGATPAEEPPRAAV